MTSSEDDEAHSVPSYMLPKGTNLDSMQKKKLKKRLRAICTEMPIYMCVMKKTHVSGRSQVVVSFFFGYRIRIAFQMHVIRRAGCLA
jgi:hypothetical protein